MDFDDILKEVGGFGLYQKTRIILMVPAFIVLPWFSVNVIFMTVTPEHWCYVPEVASSNLTLEMQKTLIRPQQDPSCLMHDVNYSQILLLDNLTVDSRWPVKECSNGWQYDKSNFEATAVTDWDMVCNTSQYSNLVISLTYLGNLVGNPVYSFFADRVGRKTIFLFLASLIAVTEIGSVLSPYFFLFLILRTLTGTAIFMIYVCGYILSFELVTPGIRSGVNGLSVTCWSCGLCLISVIAWITRNWVYLNTIISLSAGGLLLYWKLLPESPRWLISRERYDEAVEILSKISKTNGRRVHEGNQLKQKIEKLGERMKKEKVVMEKDTALDLLKCPTLRKRFLLVTLGWIGNYIPYYGLMLNVKHLAGNEFLNLFLMGVVEIPSHFAAWYSMERIGRRWCLVSTCILTALACLIPVIFSEEYTTLGIVATLFGKCSTSMAFLIIYQLCPELMPTTLRGAGMGFSTTVGTSSMFVVPYIVHLGQYGTSLPFLVFSAIAFVTAVCVSFLPETLNKSLPQTVNDAENFEKNFKYFSFCKATDSLPDSETIQSNLTLASLSVADLTPSEKNLPAMVDHYKTVKNLKKRNSATSVISSDYALHV